MYKSGSYTARAEIGADVPMQHDLISLCMLLANI